MTEVSVSYKLSYTQHNSKEGRAERETMFALRLHFL